MNTNISEIKCMCTNVRSIINKGKREELQCLLFEKGIAKLGVTDSWANEDISDAELNKIGYNVFQKDIDFDKVRKKRGGGVLLYVRDDSIAHEIEYEEYNCEAIFVSINILGVGKLVIGLCNRSAYAEKEFVNSSRFIRKHTDEAAIIMRDFNYAEINWETLEEIGRAHV